MKFFKSIFSKVMQVKLGAIIIIIIIIIVIITF